METVKLSYIWIQNILQGNQQWEDTRVTDRIIGQSINITCINDNWCAWEADLHVMFVKSGHTQLKQFPDS